MEQKYPKTVTYEDLDGNKKTTVVNSEFEQRVLENQIEKQMQLKTELEVASSVFSNEMELLKRTMTISKEEQGKLSKKRNRELLEKGKQNLEKSQKRAEKKAKTNEEWDNLTTSQKIYGSLFVLSIFLFFVFLSYLFLQ